MHSRFKGNILQSNTRPTPGLSPFKMDLQRITLSGRYRPVHPQAQKQQQRSKQGVGRHRAAFITRKAKAVPKNKPVSYDKLEVCLEAAQTSSHQSDASSCVCVNWPSSDLLMDAIMLP